MASFLNHPALKSRRSFWQPFRECPIHRDSQSQNVHIQNAGKTWLIDFQGMRGGRPEYDLASLVYDGYARLEPEQTDELLREWENISAHSIDHRIFRACALQRIMQMLGAYANIGHNQGKTWYLDHIPPGRNTWGLLPGSTLAEPLAAMLA
ncbi:MAG: phosphotransferase [Akkermansia muciniphila]